MTALLWFAQCLEVFFWDNKTKTTEKYAYTFEGYLRVAAEKERESRNGKSKL